METALATLPLETLQVRLDEALTALHALETGDREVSVWRGDRRIQYSEASMPSLRRYIGELQTVMRAKQTGAPARGPIYLGC